MRIGAKIRFEELDAIGRDDRLGGRRGEIGEARDAGGAGPVCLVTRARHFGRRRRERGREKAGPAAAVTQVGHHEHRWEQRVFLVVHGRRMQGD